jgi:hypothetical protein
MKKIIWTMVFIGLLIYAAAGAAEQPQLQAKITDLAVSNIGEGNALFLTWNMELSIPNVYDYNIYRSTKASDKGPLIGKSFTNNYRDISLTAGTTYYYQVSVNDKAGQEVMLSDAVSGIPVKKTPKVFPLQAMTYATFWPDQFNTPNSVESLKRLQKTGTNMVVLVFNWYMPNQFSPEINYEAEKTPPYNEVLYAVNWSHRLGMKVMLMPQIDCLDNTWRGFIQPKPLDDWFGNYTNFITTYAKMAQENKAEMMSVGTEFASLSGKNNLERWKVVIENVRAIFKGEITYAANWDEYRTVSFWPLLDYIGINAHFPLSTEEIPSVESIVNGWKVNSYRSWKKEDTTQPTIFARVKEFSEKMNKPVFFTGVGFRSIVFAAAKPFEWVKPGIGYNGQAQANCYAGVIEAFKNESWFKGLNWWLWWPDPKSGGEGDNDYTPQNKPAEQVLIKYYN